ncbi:MAG: 30S ribosomal protein S12 methylthiotransferase RimO [Bacteroidetes bacterium]|nr:30S ribosomal protein S12 methylthiotransferase RimO [Bacteroidota bacterium]
MTMGCPKNVVDSEKLMAQLRENGAELLPTVEGAEIVVINTCGFIDAAKEESLDAIISTARLKSGGTLRKVYALGCLSERYRSELAHDLPEVDGFFGSGLPEELLRTLGMQYRHELLGERYRTSPSHYAYLKISEGCDNPCSFCAIPLMRGKHASRPMEEVIQEARMLAKGGVRELIVIGQDTTYYGVDRYGTQRLAELLSQLGEIEDLHWIRLMYTYPAKFPADALDVLANNPRMCKYIDMPIQHVSDKVLRSMRRGISGRALRDLLEMIRERVPGIAIRSTLIVGYPTEGTGEFEELLEFVRTSEFDRLGVFPYSQEEGTTAFSLGDPVSAREKDRRRSLVMELQGEISENRNARLVGTRRKVLIDREEKEIFVGRTEHDAPEIDNEVYVRSTQGLQVGTFCSVDIVEAYEYDIEGEQVPD